MHSIGEDGLQQGARRHAPRSTRSRAWSTWPSRPARCARRAATVLNQEFEYCPSCGDFVGEHCRALPPAHERGVDVLPPLRHGVTPRGVERWVGRGTRHEARAPRSLAGRRGSAQGLLTACRSPASGRRAHPLVSGREADRHRGSLARGRGSRLAQPARSRERVRAETTRHHPGPRARAGRVRRGAAGGAGGCRPRPRRPRCGAHPLLGAVGAERAGADPPPRLARPRVRLGFSRGGRGVLRPLPFGGALRRAATHPDAGAARPPAGTRGSPALPCAAVHLRDRCRRTRGGVSAGPGRLARRSDAGRAPGVAARDSCRAATDSRAEPHRPRERATRSRARRRTPPNPRWPTRRGRRTGRDGA